MKGKTGDGGWQGEWLLLLVPEARGEEGPGRRIPKYSVSKY